MLRAWRRRAVCDVEGRIVTDNPRALYVREAT